MRGYRRDRDGAWVGDPGPGLRLDPNALELFQEGILEMLHAHGVAAPQLSFSYQAERYEAEVEAGDRSAVVPHLVLKALALALGNGDRKALGELGRAAQRYIRSHVPGYLAVGDGDGLLDQKGDEGRVPGKERLLRSATAFCRDLDEETDFGTVAAELAADVELLHRESFDVSVAEEARARPDDTVTPAPMRLEERLAAELERSTNPTPESVARLALKTFGVPTDKVRHYFDYRYAGVHRSKTDTRWLGGAERRIPAYVAQPATKGPITAAVVVLPELYGVSDHAQDVARRLAREGFLGIVPHLLHRTIDASASMEVRRRLAAEGRSLETATIMQALGVVLADLTQRRRTPVAKVGLLGFEAGAALAHEVVTSGTLRVDAAVSFYGVSPSAGGVHRAPLLSLIGDLDPLYSEPRVQALSAALAERGDGSKVEVVRGAGRGFFDPGRRSRTPRTPPSAPSSEDSGYFDLRLRRYHDAQASEVAWDATIAFLKNHLRP